MKQLSVSNRITNRESTSFKQYLSDIAKIDVFSGNEEFECAIKIQSGDEEALQELIRRNLRFVISVAKHYSNPTNPLEDLVNEGNIGLIIAAKKFNPDKETKFISYAVFWVQKMITDHLSKHSRIVRLPANKINSLSKLNKQINQLEQKLGRNVDIAEIVNEFGFEDENGDTDTSEFELLDVLNTYGVSSLDKEIGGDDHTTLADLILDENSFKSTDHLVSGNNVKIEIDKLVCTLIARDKYVISNLFGLNDNSPMTLAEIGDELGVSREMVRQIKNSALKKLNSKIKHQL